MANVTVVSTASGIPESETTTRKRTNSLNDSEEGSPEPGSQSPTHTPPLTPALTPQREDTPAPENLSLRKSGSPPQTQQTLQPVDLVQPRPSPPLPPLAVSFAILDLMKHRKTINVVLRCTYVTFCHIFNIFIVFIICVSLFFSSPPLPPPLSLIKAKHIILCIEIVEKYCNE